MAGATGDWDPGSYARFRNLRLRPALDLLMQVGNPGPGDVVDLGCGDGAAAAVLRSRFPKRRIVGVDASPAMLERARGYHATALADIAAWQPQTPPGLIFSNAALHWLSDHGALLPRLAGLLAPGGVLAVQMPRQHDGPSHRLIRETALRLFPGRYGTAPWVPPVGPPDFYWRLLSPLGTPSVWETEYLQVLDPVAQGHPVRHFTQSTAMRPWLAPLAEAEVRALLTAYDAALSDAYPPLADGRVLFPFRRLFLILTREA